MPLENVVFPRAGKYTFEVRVKGKKLRGPSIFVMEVDTGAAMELPPTPPTGGDDSGEGRNAEEGNDTGE